MAISGILNKERSRVERKLVEEKKRNKNNPRKGVLWFLFYCCIKSLALIFTSILFKLNNQPEDPERNLQPFQMIASRSLIALITMIAYYNKKLKAAVFDDVVKKTRVSYSFWLKINCRRFHQIQSSLQVRITDHLT